MLLRVQNEAVFSRFQKHLLHLFLFQLNEKQNFFIFKIYVTQMQMFYLQQRNLSNDRVLFY